MKKDREIMYLFWILFAIFIIQVALSYYNVIMHGKLPSNWYWDVVDLIAFLFVAILRELDNK